MEVSLSSGILPEHYLCLRFSNHFCVTDKEILFVVPSVAVEVQGYLTLRCSLKLVPRVHSISRASFCPLLSLEKGEYIGSAQSLSVCLLLLLPECILPLHFHV